ncbi:MAG: FtsX-like permease family protein, partial [Bacillota bacterium]|nr:FtsX-like permease family protein [Bacillota bacterium]
KDMWGVKRISGVKAAEKRFVANAEAGLEGKPALRLYALPDKNTLDTPKIIKGGLKSRGGAVLDVNFAAANGINIGDKISVKLNGVYISFRVEGLGLTSEHIHSVKNSASLVTGHKEFGFIVVRAARLEEVYGREVYNQLCVKLSPGADAFEAEKKIEKIFGDRLLGVTEKDDSASVNFVNARVDQFKVLGMVFPFMFFVVTALITLSTMKRLVENQRGQIGLLKALGYEKRKILRHYTSYGVYMGLSGALTGALIGPVLFGRALIPRMMLTLADTHISVYFLNLFISALFILACTGGVSCYSCLKLLNDTPASLLRDKPPKEGSRILLERFTKFWSGIKYRTKLIVRNAMKNKIRIIVSVSGVSVCTGALITAFTLKSTIGGMPNRVYGGVYTYDYKVILADRADSRFIKSLHLDGVVQEIEEQNMEIIGPDGIRKMETVAVYPEKHPLSHLSTADGKSAELPEYGVAVTRKLAGILHIRPGDKIQIKRSGDSFVSVPVKLILYMESDQKIFITESFWKHIGEDFKPSAVYIKWHGAPDGQFLSGDYADEYVSLEKQKNDLNKNLRVIDIAAFMMIAIGAALAFVVLYNTSMLNYFERIRDLATLRVLGYYMEEIHSLVLVENAVSVALGFVLGIPVGGLFSFFTINQVGGQQMDFIAHVTFGTVLLSAVIMAVFAFIINRVIAGKMRSLNMLEALKSVE